MPEFFVCDICGQQFANADELVVHFELTHMFGIPTDIRNVDTSLTNALTNLQTENSSLLEDIYNTFYYFVSNPLEETEYNVDDAFNRLRTSVYQTLETSPMAIYALAEQHLDNVKSELTNTDNDLELAKENITNEILYKQDNISDLGKQFIEDFNWVINDSMKKLGIDLDTILQSSIDINQQNMADLGINLMKFFQESSGSVDAILTELSDVFNPMSLSILQLGTTLMTGLSGLLSFTSEDLFQVQKDMMKMQERAIRDNVFRNEETEITEESE